MCVFAQASMLGPQGNAVDGSVPCAQWSMVTTVLEVFGTLIWTYSRVENWMSMDLQTRFFLFWLRYRMNLDQAWSCTLSTIRVLKGEEGMSADILPVSVYSNVKPHSSSVFGGWFNLDAVNNDPRWWRWCNEDDDGCCCCCCCCCLLMMMMMMMMMMRMMMMMMMMIHLNLEGLVYMLRNLDMFTLDRAT